jgi:3-hydroxybutyryl-CoA dehydrogenase
MRVNTIGVIGAGQMGSGIAQVAAASGFDVVMLDINAECIKVGMSVISSNLIRSVEKGTISADTAKSILLRIKSTNEYEELRDVDFVVEAASEVQDIKFKVFQMLDEVCSPKTILSSNTSSIPIGRIASITKRPDKVIGMHFMNPVPVMKLVEVIRGLPTSDETFQATIELVAKMNKEPAVANDYPGFIANRILLPMINEAIFCLYQSVGNKESIDSVMKLGMNHPMGPLELADLIGLDTCLSILETLYQGFGDPKYRPCPMLRQYVEAGWLGRKSGRGFYSYREPVAM